MKLIAIPKIIVTSESILSLNPYIQHVRRTPMLAVSVSISQSRSWLDENKTIGMCVKGGVPTTSLSSGLFSFTLPTTQPRTHCKTPFLFPS
ncbi:MAG: hypothetical protein V5A88_10160 [Candidatus Thermoplasmatota archaeon]